MPLERGRPATSRRRCPLQPSGGRPQRAPNAPPLPSRAVRSALRSAQPRWRRHQTPRRPPLLAWIVAVHAWSDSGRRLLAAPSASAARLTACWTTQRRRSLLRAPDCPSKPGARVGNARSRAGHQRSARGRRRSRRRFVHRAAHGGARRLQRRGCSPGPPVRASRVPAAAASKDGPCLSPRKGGESLRAASSRGQN